MQDLVFDPKTGFGGNGVGDSQCVQDGPFKNLRLHMETGNKYADYCLSRSFDFANFEQGDRTNIEACYQQSTYDDAWSCYFFHPHAAGHIGTGGVMTNVNQSPGDPVFFLHHAYLDRLWWRWQQADLPARLYDMGGINFLDAATLEFIGESPVSASVTDYDGDPGNVKTLHHVLWVYGLQPNVTVSQVMDLGGEVNCAEYIG
ncbi:hypothetical protein N7488_008516 [Penicillium malachiteum]|nr:hypothetical protein N7488_008516 [Penicillium malachiteum]